MTDQSTGRSYGAALGGLPGQSALLTDRAIFTDAYAVITARCLSDIVTSRLPHWRGAKIWILARPMTGFAESFAQYVMEIAPGGGSDQPEPDPGAEGALFVMAGQVEVALPDQPPQRLSPGGFAYLPPSCGWRLTALGDTPARLHWFRKAYEPVAGLDQPDPIFAHDADIAPTPMPDTNGAWATTLFTDPDDLRHDMAITIVTLGPGAVIPFPETHVMEHGLFVLAGKGAYKLNTDWVEVEAGDFMWLRAFCPQACYAGGPGPFRYLLYKDVNRHPALRLAPGGGR